MNRERPSRATRIRDNTLLCLALVGIGYQQVTGNVSIPLLAVYMAMGGLPGVTTVIRLFRNFPTDLPPSPPAPQSSATAPGPSSTPPDLGADDGP